MIAVNFENDFSSLECSICLELLCEPMQLPCSHVFCRKCIAGMVQQSRHCALCRASIPESFDPIVAPLHKTLEQVLMRQCTVEYTQRVQEVALEAARLVRLRIGNKYEFLGMCPRPRHQWTVEVELEAQADACLPRDAKLPDIIKHVRFAVPPSCRIQSSGSSHKPDSQPPPKFVQVDDGPFQVTAVSPMSCTIPIIITWKDWIGQPPLRLEHSLDFTRDGGCWDYGVDLTAAMSSSPIEDLQQTQVDLQRGETLGNQSNVSSDSTEHTSSNRTCESVGVTRAQNAPRKRRSMFPASWSRGWLF